MPAPVVAAGIGAGTSLLGGILGNKAQNKALKAQEAANAESVALEREQLAEQKRQYDQHQAQVAPLLALRYSLAAKYGAKIPTAMGQPNYMPAGPMGGPAGAPGAPPEAPPEMTPEGMPMRPRLRLEDLQNWSGWRGMEGR